MYLTRAISKSLVKAISVVVSGYISKPGVITSSRTVYIQTYRRTNEQTYRLMMLALKRAGLDLFIKKPKIASLFFLPSLHK